MKKALIVFLVAIVLLLGSVYILIPNSVVLKTSTAVRATGTWLHRMLLDKENIVKWWPGEIRNDSFYLNDFSYIINNDNVTLLPVSINGRNTDLTTYLILISIITDSTRLEWQGSMTTSLNPFRRFLDYQKAKRINRDMAHILQKMNTFYSNPENIYGFDIKKELVADSILITTSGGCNGYPTTRFIYNLIYKLRNYIKSQSANESGYPMLNIGTTDSIHFEVQVAIPTDRILPSTVDIKQKNMPGRGNLLVTEVKGGTEITTKAFKQLQKYTDDYHRRSPAISFYSLITDRTKEPDTNKWVTKIYFPVM